MSLRTKIFLAFGATLCGLLAALYLVSERVVLAGFEQEERRIVERNLERVLSTLEDDRVDLGRVTRDWSAWDDTYRFIQDGNQAYIESNLASSTTFSNLRLNIAVFLRSSGEVVFAQGFDLGENRQVDVPADLWPYLRPGSPLLRFEETAGGGGIVALGQGPLLAASEPVLTSDEQGPSRGVVVFGRFLNSAEIERVARLTHLSLAGFQPGDPSLPRDVHEALGALDAGQSTVIVPLDERTIAGYALLRDVLGRPALVLRVSMARDVYSRGRMVVLSSTALLLGIGLLGGLLMIALLDRLVLSRLARLSAAVNRINVEGDLAHRLPVAGKDEIGRLAANINVMLESMERSAEQRQQVEEGLRSIDRQREEFLSLVSHELRHPVAAIALVAEALAATPGLREPDRRALQRVRQQARSLARLAEEVLEIARVESDQVQLHPTETELGALLADLVQQTSEPERVELVLPEEPLWIVVDPERLGMALDNVIRNALKYSPPASPVSVALKASATEVRVEVRDQGIGMAPEDLAQLFQKYARLRNVRTSGIHGVGLGLYLTRLLLEAHGGTIEAASPGPGLGATFTIRLPRSGLATEPPGQPRA